MSAPSMGSYSEQSHESLSWVAQDRLHLKAVPYYVHVSDDHFPSRLPHLPSTSLPYWHEAIPTTYSGQFVLSPGPFRYGNSSTRHT